MLAAQETKLKQLRIARLSAVLLLISIAPALAEKQLLWGDTHLHTNLSTDAYINQNFTATPETAYRYASGLPVLNPANGERVQIRTPLDFLVVADHAGGMGTVKMAVEQGFSREGLGVGEWIRSFLLEKLYRFMVSNPGHLDKLLVYAFPKTDDVRDAANNPASVPIPGQDVILRDTWAEVTAIADDYNQPGTFTALIGWEWTSIPAGANLHRVIFTDGDGASARQFVPLTAPENNHPQSMWRWLEEVSASTGADFISIPHNSNISRGFMFPTQRKLSGEAIDAEWVDLRARWEPVVEVTQVKGDSETHPDLSPEDPFADFEGYPHIISPRPISYEPTEADFARSALRTGLELEQQFGTNPYRFGMIGATDSHTGLATAEEPNFWGKFPTDGRLESKTTSVNDIQNFGWLVSASGLAGVWAEGNDRESIMRAFKRREVFATTGPMMAVRVYAAPEIPRTDTGEIDEAAMLASAVPMGGELQSLDMAPSFYIEALKDPLSGHLDRIQVVKGWLQDDGTRERVFDVAWAGDRAPAGDGKVPAIIDTVDPKTGFYSNVHGAPALTAVWTDPEFDPSQPAFYYVRVLEVPTPRHSTLDALALGQPPESTGYPVSIQERAYTSPIHYRP
jgi:Protein of unknown function (DUF3604)